MHVLTRRWVVLLCASLAAACLLAVAGPAFGAVPLYSLTDLGSLGGDQTIPTDINDRGEIVGVSFVNVSIDGALQRVGHPFIWSHDRMRDLGGSASGGSAAAINNSGQVLLRSLDGACDTVSIYAPRGVRAPLPGTCFSGTAMNDAGAIGGEVGGHASLFSDGRVRDLGTFGAIGGWDASWVKAVNSAGTVVGGSYIHQDPPPAHGAIHHAFVSDGDSIRDLGNLGGDFSDAYGINDEGEIVGFAEAAPGVPHAFVYSDRVMHDLGAPSGTEGSEARAINDAGVVVGIIYNGQAFASHGVHAMIYTDGAMQDLNEVLPPGSGLELQDAIGINDVGQIVGTGFRDGRLLEHAYLLTPLASRINVQAVRNQVEARLAAVKTKAARGALARALASLDRALESQRWQADSSLTLDEAGLDGLRALRAAAGRLAWESAELRDATRSERSDIAGAMAAIARTRFDEVWAARAQRWPANAFLLWRAERYLDVADADRNRVRATLGYIEAWRILIGEPAASSL